MVKKITDIIKKNPLLSGSFIVFVGTTLANFGSYLFHLATGRLLGPTDYGILASLISVSYYLGIPVSVLTLIVVRFVSQRNKNREEISLFVKKFSRKISPYGFLVFLGFLLAFPLLRMLIKVDSFVLFLGLGAGCFFSVYLAIILSTLQGIMKFSELSVLNIFGSWSKLIISVVAVVIGLKVTGVVYAIFLSTILSLWLGYGLVKKYIPLNLRGDINIKDSFGNLKSYSLAVLISNISLVSLFTIDIVLARYFLSPNTAGQYASLSVLGKIVYFASSPIISVMFPMVSERQANGKNYQKLFWSTLLLILTISMSITLVYFLLPQQMVLFLFGKKYLAAAPYLGLFAVFLTFYSLCSLFMNFYLSISKKRVIYFGPAFILLQVVLICFYHRDIPQIVTINIITTFLFLLYLVVYYLHEFPVNLKMKTFC